MANRRITALAAAALAAVTGLAFAPAAHAVSASPSDLSVNCDSGPSSGTTFSGPIGSTFAITNTGSAASCHIVSLTGADATGFSGADEIAPGGMATFTITGVGGFHISAGGYAAYTIEVTEGSSGGGVPTAADLPGPPTNIVATAGNGAVKLTWSAPTSMGSGDFLQYGFNFQQTGTQGETYGCTTTRTTCMITGLTNGQPYTLIGYTQSTIGWSPSASTNVVTTSSSVCTNPKVDVTAPTGVHGQAQSPITVGAVVTSMPYIAVPYGGDISTPAIGGWNTIQSWGAPGGQFAQYTPDVTGACAFSVSAPEGVKLLLQDPRTTALTSSTGSQTLDNVSPGTPVYAFGTKTGVFDITFTSRLDAAGSTATVTPKLNIGSPMAAAYSVTSTPSSAEVSSGDSTAVTFTVRDAFGNVVPLAYVDLAATGQATLPGGAVAGSARTDANGQVRTDVSMIASGSSGTVSATITSANGAPASAPNYITPAAFNSAPVMTATTNVTSAATKSIVITGERTTVSGKSGIRVEGVTQGFAEGAIVNPWIKLAGQTGYTKGIDVTVDADGKFTWQRKTGKKVYVLFKSADETVKSTVVIIQTA